MPLIYTLNPANALNTVIRTPRSVGNNPNSVSIHQSSNGVVWAVSADYNGNILSFFPISGVDGVIDSSIITGSTRTPRSVGNNPNSVSIHQSSNGVVWAVSADYGSNALSFFPISGVDGVIDSSIITGSTRTSRSVGNNPNSVSIHQSSNGVVWAASADPRINALSFFPISGVDGVIDSSIITGSTRTNRTVGVSPSSVVIHQSSNGVVWAASADTGSGLSFFPISGVDGVIDSSIITGSTRTPKPVGVQPIDLAIHQSSNGVVWAASAEYGSNALSFFPISGVDGVIDSSIITGSIRIPKTAGERPVGVAIHQSSNGVVWAASADAESNTLSFFPINNVPLLYSSAEDPKSYLMAADNVAEVTTSLISFDFILGVQGGSSFNFAVFGRMKRFSYSGTLNNPSGTLATGNTIRLTSAAADIDNIDITLAGGSTFRLGKKAGPYTVALTTQSGSTIEVFPDSDRSDAPLNLRNQSIASGSNINATSGTATVLVSSIAGLVAGSGVTLQEPVVSIRLFGLPTVSSTVLRVKDLTSGAVTNPTVASGEVTIPTNAARNYEIRADAPGYLAQQVTLSGATPAFEFNLPNYRSLYDLGVSISSQVLFNYSTAGVTIKDTAATISFADIFRTIEDYLATNSGLEFDSPPYPVVLPDRNLLWFPKTPLGGINPVRIKPDPANISDPTLLFETYLEGATDTSYGLFDFSAAGGRIIRIRSVVAIAQVQGDGSFTSTDRSKLNSINTKPFIDTN